MIYQFIAITLVTSQVVSWPVTNEDIAVQTTQKTHHPLLPKSIAIINNSFERKAKPIISFSFEIEKSNLNVEDGTLPPDWRPIWLKETHPYLVLKNHARDKTPQSNNEPKRGLKVAEVQSNRELSQIVESTSTGKQFSTDEIIPENNEISSRPLKNSSTETTSLSAAREVLTGFDQTTAKQSTHDNKTTSVQLPLPAKSTSTAEITKPNNLPKLPTSVISQNEMVSSDESEMRVFPGILEFPGEETSGEITTETWDQTETSLTNPSLQEAVSQKWTEMSMEVSQSMIRAMDDEVTTPGAVHRTSEKAVNNSQKVSGDGSDMRVFPGILEFPGEETSGEITTETWDQTEFTTSPSLQEAVSQKWTEMSMEVSQSMIQEMDDEVTTPGAVHRTSEKARRKKPASLKNRTTLGVFSSENSTTTKPEIPLKEEINESDKNNTDKLHDLMEINYETKTNTADPKYNASQTIPTTTENLIKTDNQREIDITRNHPTENPIELSENTEKLNTLERSNTKTSDNVTTASLTKNRTNQAENQGKHATERATTPSPENFLVEIENTDDVSVETSSESATTTHLMKTTNSVTVPENKAEHGISENLALENGTMITETPTIVTTISLPQNRTNSVENFSIIFTTEAAESKTTSSLNSTENSTLGTFTDSPQSATVENGPKIDIANSFPVTDANLLQETLEFNETQDNNGLNSVTTTLSYLSPNLIKLSTEPADRSGLSNILPEIEISVGGTQTTGVNYASPGGNKTVQAETSPAEEALIEEMVNATEDFNSYTISAKSYEINSTQPTILNETLTTTASTGHGVEKVISETINISKQTQPGTLNKDKTETSWGLLSTTPVSETGHSSEHEDEEYEESQSGSKE